MTPGARVQAAIEILDRIIAGDPAEKVLTTWGRRARHAGSKDRAAVRDHVFDALRRFRSAPALGKGTDGRAWMIGLLRGQGEDPDAYFTGQGYAPGALSPHERVAGGTDDPLVALDCPAAAAEGLKASLGDDFGRIIGMLRDRAPLFLRVNRRRGDRASAIDELASEGIVARLHPLSDHALEIVEGGRRVSRSALFARGVVEIQDVGSQAVVDRLPLSQGMRVLDYCAGAGGKTLAMADRVQASFFAHDANFARLANLVPRADRAGVPVTLLDRSELASEVGFDLVLVDAPCSGSGAWRRSPEAKFRFHDGTLEPLLDLQLEILRHSGELVSTCGLLAYATCSLFHAENEAQIDRFLVERSGWAKEETVRFTPLDGGDGFYLALLKRETTLG